MALDLHFSSATDDWSTPQDLFDDCNQIFGFTLDVCALPHNAKCLRYYSQSDDGLIQPCAGTLRSLRGEGRRETGSDSSDERTGDGRNRANDDQAAPSQTEKRMPVLESDHSQV